MKKNKISGLLLCLRNFYTIVHIFVVGKGESIPFFCLIIFHQLPNSFQELDIPLESSQANIKILTGFLG